MVQSAGSDTEKKVLAILKILSESVESVGSITIARELEKRGIFLSERAVRYHLGLTDARGFTESMGRDGRILTSLGREELRNALAPDMVRFILEKMELMAYNTTFDPTSRTGTVAINTSIFERDEFDRALGHMVNAFKAGFCVSELCAVAEEGEKLGDVIVPHGKVGFATVCGVTINGVLLKAGIPMESKFGGVLEIANRRPKRFTAIINYGGTSLDPSVQYIKARMTSVQEASKTGEGRVLANFREILGPSRAVVDTTLGRLKEAGIDGVYSIGATSEPMCQIAVSMNRAGMILLGGLNPVAAAAETGIEAENVTESGMLEYSRLTSFWTLRPRTGQS